MLDKSLTLIEVLGLAVTQEIAAHKRYKLFAQRVKNPLVKEKFLSLSREELAHQDILYSMLKKYTNEDKPPLPKTPPRSDEISDGDKSLSEIIELAIEKEIEAKEFYLEAAELAQDPSGKHLLRYLAVFEEGHEQTLKAELKSITDYPRWFDMEGPDIMLVGP